MKTALLMSAILMLSCCTMFYDPTDVEEPGKPAEELYRIVIFENHTNLGTLYPRYGTTDEGRLIDSDFKKYVMKEIEGTGYLYVYWYRVQRTYREGIEYAYVYYPKKELK